MEMPKWQKRLILCSCGTRPVMWNEQVAEDCVETWVTCPGCGATTDRAEGAYSEPETAEHMWNSGQREPVREPT